MWEASKIKRFSCHPMAGGNKTSNQLSGHFKEGHRRGDLSQALRMYKEQKGLDPTS